MRNFTIALTVGLGALTLAACGGEKKAEDAKTTPAGGSAAASPSPKAGLWEETSTIEGMGEQTLRKCVGENSGDIVSAMGAQAEKVCTPKITPGPGGWDMAVTCDMGTGGKVESKAKVSGDMTSAYTSEAVTTISGAEAPQMNRTMKVTLKAKYLGACPEGMNPGSVDIGNMIIDSSGMKK